MAAVHPAYPVISRDGGIRLLPRILTFVVLLLLPTVAVAGAIVLACYGLFSPVDFWIFLGMFVATGFGTTVGYHRLFTHRSFEASGAVRWVLAILGCMNAQGAPIIWAAQHRRHHACSDEAGDPHSPHEGRPPGFFGAICGLWHSHIGHIFNQVEPIEPERYAPDLERDPFLRWLENWGAVVVIAGLLIPAAIGWALTGSWVGAATGFLWGGWIRLFVVTHATGAINSVCHFFGSKKFEARDRSGNVPWLIPVTFGECWHHNHHVFPTSARHGLRWWQVDPSWMVIWTLEKLGLARDVVRIPIERQNQKLLKPEVRK